MVGGKLFRKTLENDRFSRYSAVRDGKLKFHGIVMVNESERNIERDWHDKNMTLFFCRDGGGINELMYVSSEGRRTRWNAMPRQWCRLECSNRYYIVRTRALSTMIGILLFAARRATSR